MNSLKPKIIQSESEIVAELKQHFREMQERTTSLLKSYKEYFSESQIKSQKWWRVDTTDGRHILHMTFNQATERIKPAFSKQGHEIPQSEFMEILSKDEDFEQEFESLAKYGWEGFVAETVWEKGLLWLPYPITAQGDVIFSPVHQGKYIEDPIEMAKLIGLPTQPNLDPVDIIQPISVAELNALNSNKINTDESKTLKQVLTEPYRVQKKKGYYSYESFRQLFLTGFLMADKLTGYQSWLPQPASKAVYHFKQAAVNYCKQEQIDQGLLPGAMSYAIEFISTPHKSIFYLDEKLLNMLMQTNLPTKAKINQCFLPSFLLLLPKNNLLGFNSIFFHFHQGNGLLASAFFSDERGVINCDCFTSQIDQEVETTYLTESFGQCAFNFLLWQQSMHDKGQEIIELDAPTRKMDFGKNTKQVIIPRVIGEGYKPKVIRNYETTGTHASPRTHWRSGHWRQQPYGKKDDPKLKTIWLEPVLVNG